MNERLFLKLLFTLFSALLAAELLVATLFSFRLELLVFCFVIAVALTGMLVVVRLFSQPRAEIDSVSSRRAKAKRSDVMRDRLSAYSVDEEFLGGERFTESPAPRQTPARASSSSSSSSITLEEAITAHASMYGGLQQLLKMMEKIDEKAFRQLLKKVGCEQLSREEIIVKITLMIEADDCSCPPSEGAGKASSSLLENHSLDQESFDDYIRRSMTSSDEDDSAGSGDGFSVDLDEAALPRGVGRPPDDFSHNPKAMMESLRRAGMKQ